MSDGRADASRATPRGGTGAEPVAAGPGGASTADQVIACVMMMGGIGSFQIGASLAKSLFPTFGPLGMVGLRVCIAALILNLVWRKGWVGLPWRLLLPYGVAMAVMNTCFYVALARLPLGITVALEFMGPLSLALFGSRRWLDLLWAGLVIGGVVLLLRPAGRVGHLDPVGVICALSAGCGWVVYILTGTRIGREMDATRATALGMGIAALLLLPDLVLTLPVAWHNPHQAWLAVAVAVMSSAVPYVLDMMAMKRLTPRELGVLLSLEPLTGTLSGLFLLGETLSPWRWVGVGSVVAASVGNVLSGRPEPRE